MAASSACTEAATSPAEVGGAADRLQIQVRFGVDLQRQGVDDLPAVDQLGEGAKKLAVQWIGKVIGLQEFGDAVVRGVVHQDRAQQRLLSLEICGKSRISVITAPASAR